MIVTLTDKAEARRRVALATGASEVPVISDAEIEGVAADPDADPPVVAVAGILDLFPLATIWAPSTRYVLGAAVIPTEANETGRYYRLLGEVSGGSFESGTTEPVWPRYSYECVRDNDLYWQDRGAAPACLWDIDRAINEVFKRKLNLALTAPKSFELDARDKFDLGSLVSDLQAAVERTQPFLVGRSW